MTEEVQYIVSTITASIPEFIDKFTESKRVIFFIIEVYNNYSKQDWKLEKRYSEFEALYKNLAKIIPDVPVLPGKTLFQVTALESITKRRVALDTFIKQCVKRKDIVSNEFFKVFLEIDKHSPELSYNAPTKIHEYSNIPLGIRDFYYYVEESMLFIVCAEMNIGHRLDSYISNVSMPWDKNKETHVSVGGVLAYRLSTSNENTYVFDKKWEKSFPEQTGVVNFDEESQTLLIGLDSGKISLYKTSSDNDFNTFDELCEIKPHKDRVMGIGFDSTRGYIYSCSSDKKFYVNEINYQSSNLEVADSTFGYTNLLFDKKNSRIFLTNEAGLVFVFNSSVYPPVLVNFVKTHTSNVIRGIELDNRKHFLFTATNKGDISLLDLGLPGKEKFIKELTYFGGTVEIRIVRYNIENNELIAGDQDGRITIWSLKTGQPTYAWQAHHGAITQMYYSETNRVLFSGGKDKKMIFWRLPDKWTNDEITAFERTEIKYLNDQIAAQRIQKALIKAAENDDSSDDSLNGWDIKQFLP